MVNVRARKDSGKLTFDFYYQGVRCREQTALDDTPANRKKMKQVAEKIAAEITLGTFDYRKYFPTSKKAAQFDVPNRKLSSALDSTPLFTDFAEDWIAEMEVAWRKSTYITNVGTIRKHLIPIFGEKKVSDITRADILQFRSALAKVPGRSGNASLTNKTINHTVGLLLAILGEAADRFEFSKPISNLKRLKVPRSDIQPFTLDEVQLILRSVRPDYRNYFTVRFFTGLRTGEIHGLRWEHIDFERKQILVRESIYRGEATYTKNDGSQRAVHMSSVVEKALREQQKATGQGDYVFCTREGTPLNGPNVCDRVWYPLLRYLELKKRRPYQCRHTCATLWLAAGENPEWIARQLGHANTEMLFRVYSRYVPNLTRRDGSAFDGMLNAALNGGTNAADDNSANDNGVDDDQEANNG